MSTLPLFDPDIKELTGTHLKVACILLDNRGHFITSKVIAQRLQMPAANVRHICQQLIDNYSLEILASRLHGYRFADSVDEFLAHQSANVRQCLTGLARAKARLGERRFKALIARLAVKDAVALVEECIQ